MAPETLELLAELAAQEPERAASLEGMQVRLRETLKKTCVAVEDRTSLPAEKAMVVSGQLEAKADVLSGWASAGDSVGWLVEVSEPGTYQVQVEQSQQGVAAVVYDVFFAGDRLATRSVLTGEGEMAFKAFELGSVEIDKPGHYRLNLRVRQMPPEAGDFHLKALMLKRE